MSSCERPRRDFDPSKTRRYGRPTLNPYQLVKYSPKWQYCRVFHFPPYQRKAFRPRMLTTVIAVDGACRGNNRANPKSRAGYGVFVGPNCHRNVSELLDPTLPQTSSRAELEAVHGALVLASGMKATGEFSTWREIIIKLDSEYVAKSLSERVWKWEASGYRKANRQPVEHAAFIQRLHHMICDLETNKNMAIRFWRVDREFNKDADALAKLAFDEM